jgi:hypothetical protein
MSPARTATVKLSFVPAGTDVLVQVMTLCWYTLCRGVRITRYHSLGEPLKTVNMPVLVHYLIVLTGL